MGEEQQQTRPEDIAASDHNIKQSTDDNRISTDVPDVFADGEKMGLPVFHVSSEEFHSNMEFGRKRLRLKSGSNGQKYLAGTKYNRPFWMAHTKNGETWTRKVK